LQYFAVRHSIAEYFCSGISFVINPIIATVDWNASHKHCTILVKRLHSPWLTNFNPHVYAFLKASGVIRRIAVSGNRVVETLRCLSESSMRGMEFPKQVSEGEDCPARCLCS